jgi:hypothetical protein
VRGPALAVVAAALAVSAAATVRAELRYRVVLLRPPMTDDVTSDASARVRGELTAAGFEVSVMAQDPALDVRTALETVGRELDPIAAFAIVRAAGADTAEIWVCDRMAGRSVIQSVRLDSEGTAGEPPRSAVLAVQAVELLKASLAQYWLASVQRLRQREAPPVPAPPPPTFATTGLGVAAGVCWLDNVGAITAAWQPIVRASYGGAGGWAGRLAVAGLGTDAEARGPEGTAQIRQQFGTAEIVRSFRAGKRVQPVVSIGAGVYHARISGAGSGPQSYANNVAGTWSALGAAGAGLIMRTVSRISLVGDAQIGLTWPDNLIRIVGTEVGRTGRPSLLVSIGLLATF